MYSSGSHSSGDKSRLWRTSHWPFQFSFLQLLWRLDFSEARGGGQGSGVGVGRGWVAVSHTRCDIFRLLLFFSESIFHTRLAHANYAWWWESTGSEHLLSVKQRNNPRTKTLVPVTLHWWQKTCFLSPLPAVFIFFPPSMLVSKNFFLIFFKFYFF